MPPVQTTGPDQSAGAAAQVEAQKPQTRRGESESRIRVVRCTPARRPPACPPCSFPVSPHRPRLSRPFRGRRESPHQTTYRLRSCFCGSIGQSTIDYAWHFIPTCCNVQSPGLKRYWQAGKQTSRIALPLPLTCPSPDVGTDIQTLGCCLPPDVGLGLSSHHQPSPSSFISTPSHPITARFSSHTCGSYLTVHTSPALVLERGLKPSSSPFTDSDRNPSSDSSAPSPDDSLQSHSRSVSNIEASHSQITSSDNESRRQQRFQDRSLHRPYSSGYSSSSPQTARSWVSTVKQSSATSSRIKRMVSGDHLCPLSRTKALKPSGSMWRCFFESSAHQGPCAFFLFTLCHANPNSVLTHIIMLIRTPSWPAFPTLN